MLEFKELEELQGLFEQSEGELEYLQIENEGDFIGLINTVEFYESQKNKLMIRVNLTLEEPKGLVSVYLASTPTIHFVDRFKTLCNKLEITSNDLEKAFESMAGLKVLVTARRGKNSEPDSSPFLNITKRI